MPPINIPNTKIKFHISFFQLYLKKGIFAGKQAAQACLREELIPKDLFPSSNNAGTVKPTKGPAIYQGQGCLINSNMIISYLDKQNCNFFSLIFVTLVTEKEIPIYFK